MGEPAPGPRPALSWARLLPSWGMACWALALFLAGMALARQYAGPLQEVLAAHAAWGLVVFVATSALAVLLPAASNLPLVPVATLVFGPGWTALWLLAGWVLGATLSFWLGRYAQPWVRRRLPAAARHADIERLIRPTHRLVSLVLLRMTSPVDVLSYALGLFSRSTTALEVALSTLIGAAPFALLFAWFPALSGAAQWAVFAASTLVFALYVLWVWRGAARGGL